MPSPPLQIWGIHARHQLHTRSPCYRIICIDPFPHKPSLYTLCKVFAWLFHERAGFSKSEKISVFSNDEGAVFLICVVGGCSVFVCERNKRAKAHTSYGAQYCNADGLSIHIPAPVRLISLYSLIHSTFKKSDNALCVRGEIAQFALITRSRFWHSKHGLRPG